LNEQAESAKEKKERKDMETYKKGGNIIDGKNPSRKAG
jgi:hypothetical protein